MNKIYRDNGAKGALLDEYERALAALDHLLEKVSPEQLVAIVDESTDDEDCRSIQTILSHVISSGYYYATAVRKWKGEELDIIPKELLPKVSDYQKELKEMFAYSEKVFNDYPNMVIETHEEDKKIHTRWGQRFDVEQLFEHAIVHILRHRRQIERFLLRLAQK